MAGIRALFQRRRERSDRRQLAAGRSSVWQGIDTTLGELRAPARVRRAPVTTPFLPGVVQRAARESARPSRKRKASSPMAAKKAVTKKAATRAVKAAVHKPAVKAEIKKVARAEVKKVVRRRRVGVYRQYSAPIGPMPRGPRGGRPKRVRLAAKAITPVRARRRYPRRRKAS